MSEKLLNEMEANQSGVQKIVKYFEERLIRLRHDNDPFDAPIAIRGQIIEVKKFQTKIEPGLKSKIVSNHSAL